MLLLLLLLPAPTREHHLDPSQEHGLDQLLVPPP